jgi:predicted short-subunit dehydrogenase-like oxidoreductase (DUF2520 family)
MAEPHRIFILGAGRVGTALAIALERAGAAPAGLWTRSPASAERARRLTGVPCWQGALPEMIGQATRVILAVSDPATASLAGALLDGGLLRSSEVVLHCAGGRPAAEALAGLGPPLARGTFHPLLAIADPEAGARHLAGAAIALEGDEAARRAGAEVARCLGARPVELPAGGLLAYHTAAVLASNHAVALWAAALELLGLAGVPAEEQLPALQPLISSTLTNLGALGVPAALTGPVRRGDAAQVARALELLDRAAPHLSPLYLAATAQALRLARALSDPAAEPGLQQIEELLRSRA